MAKTKTVEYTEEDLEQGRKAFHAIEEDIENLKKELKAGTLDRKRLESGLERLDRHVEEIPDHPWE
jgi:hypothetical protein